MKKKRKKVLNKKFLAVTSIAMSLIVFTSCGGVAEKTQTSENYYKLTYYDNLDDTIGYNNDLFYINHQTDIGPDPSVIYGKGSDGNKYFYIFPTSTNYSFYAYRSTDMSNLQGAGTVFLPERNSWVSANMWAPDVIYDPEAPDGEGGKGLYYFFFTGTDKYRAKTYDDYFFDNRIDRESYKVLKEEVYALTDTQVIEVLSYTNLTDKVEELCNTYGIENQSKVNSRLSMYQVKKNAIESRTDIDENEKQTEIAQYAKEVMLSIRAADIHTVLPRAATKLAMGIATAKTLDGPFIQYTNDGMDGNREIAIEDPFFTHEDIYAKLNERYGVFDGLHIIDAHAFVDPKNGDKYMYFNADPCAPSSFSSTAEIYVVKVGDKNTRWTDDWQWDTVKQVTRVGYVDMGENEVPKKEDSKSDLGETAINEGAYMVYNEKNDKYYLMMSKGRYNTKGYAVIQSVSDSPMGPFRKFSREEGGIVIQSEQEWDFVVGPGHHSVINYNGKLYMVYHTYPTANTNDNRTIAMDEIVWVKNNNGDYVLHCNGPTVTPQLRVNNGYENIVDKATVSVTSGDNADVLTDGAISGSHETDFVKEFTAQKGLTTVTLTFEEYRTVRALMIYNSKDYDKAFKSVYRIEMDFAKSENGEIVKGTAYIENLKYNEKYFYNWNGTNCVLPASAAIAEFAELYVKEIRITFKTATPINVSEIKVIGN